MKLFFTTFLILSIPIFCSAQGTDDNPTRQGRFMGDIDFGFISGDVTQGHSSFTGDTEIKNTTFDMDLGVGYTVIDNLVVGANVFTNHDKIEAAFTDIVGFTGTANQQVERTTSLSYYLGARYYFLKKSFKPYLGAGIGYGTQKVEGGTPDTDNYQLSGGGLAYVFNAGLSYFLNDNVGIEITYNYSALQAEMTGSGTASNFDYDIVSNDKTVASSVLFGVIIAL